MSKMTLKAQFNMTARKTKFSESDEDLYPTPPYAVNALLNRIIIPHDVKVWEPACGKGHICDVLKRKLVHSPCLGTDIKAREGTEAIPGFETLDFLDDMQRERFCKDNNLGSNDWIITNPPYQMVQDFVLAALTTKLNVAMFTRQSFLETTKRYNYLFGRGLKPDEVYVFSERVSGIAPGKLDVKMSSMVCYIWAVWHGGKRIPDYTRLHWIEPGQKKKMNEQDLLQYQKDWKYQR